MHPSENIPGRARRELDGRIIDVELALIAIIQAVPLVLLADKVAEPIMEMNWQVLPYLVVGLLTVLLFWSRAVIHTLSFIGWPLDFTHNFLYILSTLVQAILVSQIANPKVWYAIWIAYSGILWITYAVDLRMIRRQLKMEREMNDRLLLEDVLKDQLLNVRYYMPAAILLSIFAFITVKYCPVFFIAGHWHLAFVVGQVVLGLLYLWEGYGILRRRNDRILERQMNLGD